MFSFTKDIGMDLGTASVLIYIKDKGIVLNEPSVVALDKNTGKLLKVGADAQAMLGRTPGNIIAIRPLREGVISDYEVTERMIKEFLHKVIGFQLFKPRIIICVPSGITEVEERAVIDAGIQAGARRVYLIEEPVAAAIGAGIDITQPEGHMIIDIGGGTSDIAVISLSGVVESSSIKIAGDQFNEAVVYAPQAQPARRRAHGRADEDADRLRFPARGGNDHGGQGQKPHHGSAGADYRFLRRNARGL